MKPTEKSLFVHYWRRSNRHIPKMKGINKGDPSIELSVSPKDSSKRPKVVASSEDTTTTSHSNTMMEEVVADESMEEAATASDAQSVDKGKKIMEMGGTSGKDTAEDDQPPSQELNKASGEGV
ncbi:hypothetical protein L6452_08700 [Arctium lappa]|uniref:Uncharacterized protein n=1 Tax=Arctium lappa TaxID=4217 RepID=A0ACB9DHZ6_ARCLA|nr:hypothetical protein L6452_08700 [Arctium lappa]